MKKLILILLFIPLLVSAQFRPIQEKSLLNPLPLWYLSSATTLSPISSTYGLTGYTLRLNTATTNYHILALGASYATNLNGFNIVNTDINKNRTSLAQVTDTASYNFSFTRTGKPLFTIKGATGDAILNVDSAKNILFGGQILAPNGTASAPSLSFANMTNAGFYVINAGANILGFSVNGVNRYAFDTATWGFAYQYGLGWYDNAGNAVDTKLFRDGAGTLAQRNGTNFQIFNLYRTYTSASKYGRMAFKTTADSLYQVVNEFAGGHTSRPLQFKSFFSYSFDNSVILGSATGGYHKLATGLTSTTNLNAFNFTDTDINKTRTNATTASDTSSVNAKFSNTGSPTFSVIGKGGEVLFRVDSTGISSSQFAYGSVYIADSFPDSIDVTSSAKYYTVGAKQSAIRGKAWTSGGVLKNVTVQDSSMTVSIAGKYEVSYSLSLSTVTGVTNGRFNTYLFVDDVKQEKTGNKRLLPGTNDLGVIAAAPTVLSLTAGQVVKLKILSPDDSSNSIAIDYAIMHVKKIDN